MGILNIVKKLCEERNIKMTELEHALGFSRGALYKMADSSPSSEKLKQLADYFGISADYLLERTDHQNGLYNEDISSFTYEKFLKFFEANKNKLTTAQKIHLLQMISSNISKSE